MKIVSVLGSPRPKGNSAALAERFCRTAQEMGARIQTFALNRLSLRGCQACMRCKTDLERCVFEDDLAKILEAVREADILVLASPVYIGDVPSQVKTLIDRTYSYFVPNHMDKVKPSRLPSGKTLVFIQTQGNTDESRFADIYPRYAYFFKRYGFKETHLIMASGVKDPGDVEARADLMLLAEEKARELMG